METVQNRTHNLQVAALGLKDAVAALKRARGFADSLTDSRNITLAIDLASEAEQIAREEQASPQGRR